MVGSARDPRKSLILPLFGVVICFFGRPGPLLLTSCHPIWLSSEELIGPGDNTRVYLLVAVTISHALMALDVAEG
jgi:hypothetical protein